VNPLTVAAFGLLVLRLWWLSRQDLPTMLLLVQYISPLGMISALFITLIWTVPAVVLVLRALGGILVVSGIAGRLSSHVPVRALIGPGLLIAGAGLLLMRGLTASSSWTHLIPGLVVAGVGVGLINPPLASTAVGVVQPHRAGMASGINSTFRQVGIATGIALLGTLFSNRLASAVTERTQGTPLAAHSGQIATALRNGGASGLFTRTPPQQRQVLAEVVRGSFTTALDQILLVAAVVSMVAGVLAFALIRSRDFVAQH